MAAAGLESIGEMGGRMGNTIGTALPIGPTSANRQSSTDPSAGTSVGTVTSPMDDKLDDLRNRRDEAFHAGSARAVERQHEKGKLLARERIDYFLDPGSFQELDLLARHRAHAAGLEERPYTDGVITGWGTVDGRKVFVFSQKSLSRSGSGRAQNFHHCL